MSQSSSAFNPDLRQALLAMVRRRVPESEVEDIVQQTLAEAIESPHAPKESEALRKWIFGVAKNKVVDYHRRAGRETFDMPEVPDAPAPHAEADLLRWAERHLPEGDEAHKTLDWMLREGEGEKLESIAASEKVPAPRVRQRVSRLRRHFKENWKREVALLAALGIAVTALVLLLTKKEDPNIAGEPVDPRAAPMREDALRKCESREWKACLDGLDAARRLDPAGDTKPEVQRARRDAEKSLVPAPGPSSDVTPLDVRPPPAPSAEPSPKSTAAPPSSGMPPTPTPTPTTRPDSTELLMKDSPTNAAKPVATPAPPPVMKQEAKPEGKFAPSKAPSKPQGKSDIGSDFGSDLTPTPVPGGSGGTGSFTGSNSKKTK